MTTPTGTGALDSTLQSVLTAVQAASVNSDGSTNTNATIYEYNSGGPGNGNLDRARNLQGKGTTISAAITTPSTGVNTVTFSGAAPSPLPAVGMQVFLTGGGLEAVYVQAASSTTVTFTSSIVNSGHTAINYDAFSAAGPGTNGFTATGVGVKTFAGYDPTSQLYYLCHVDSSGNIYTKAAIAQNDLTGTGTISAAQPVIGTPVANATIVLAVGQGQSTWKAQLLAGGGGFTNATTIVADKSLDGATTWMAASFKVTGATPATTVSSVVGPGPIELTGNAAGVSHIRIRCSVLNSTETIAVTLRSGAGIGDIGLLSSIPSGSNTIGSVIDVPQPSSTSTITSVVAAVSTTPLLAVNSARKGAYIYNNSTANLYLAYAATSATTAFTVKIPPSVLFELPASPVWQGALSGIWDAANGNAMVTEVS